MATEIGALEGSDFYFQLAGIDPRVCLWNGHAMTFADGPAIGRLIASKIQAILETEEPSSPGYLPTEKGTWSLEEQ